MTSSSLYHRLCIFLLIAIVCVACAMSAPSSYYEALPGFKQLIVKRQPFSRCDGDENLSLICYQCGKTHASEFSRFFNPCCGNENSFGDAMRTYCHSIFREPPKRGGLWE